MLCHQCVNLCEWVERAGESMWEQPPSSMYECMGLGDCGSSCKALWVLMKTSKVLHKNHSFYHLPCAIDSITVVRVTINKCLWDIAVAGNREMSNICRVTFLAFKKLYYGCIIHLEISMDWLFVKPVETKQTLNSNKWDLRHRVRLEMLPLLRWKETHRLCT